MSHMAAEPPGRVYQSAKSRDVIADCLLDRVASPDLAPQRDDVGHVTNLGFTGPGMARKPAMYRFTIEDAGSGSMIEVRRYPGMSLAAVETCF